MRIIFVSLVVILTCNCHQNYCPQRSEKITTRHDEIRKIMRRYWINEYETGNFYWWSDEERKITLNELSKMKKDYYYELSDPNLVLTIPGPGWEIKGPLSTTDNAWNKFKKEHKEGDELFFFSSDSMSWAYLRGRAGYILIRNNKIVNRIVTKMN